MGTTGSTWGCGWRFLKALAREARRERRLLVPSFAGIGVGVLYAVALLVVSIAVHLWDQPIAIAAVSVGGAIGSWFIIFVSSAVTVRAVEMHVRGVEPDLGRCYRGVRRRWWSIAGLAVVSALVERVTEEGEGRRGFVRSLLSSLLRGFWTVASHLLLPIVVIERESLRKAVDRARALHRGKYLRIAVGDIAAVGLANLLAFLAMLGFAGTVWLAAYLFGGNAAIAYGILGGVTLLIIVTGLLRFVRVAYYTCIYVWAVDTERTGPAAAPPRLIADALGKGNDS